MLIQAICITDTGGLDELYYTRLYFQLSFSKQNSFRLWHC